MSNPFRIIVERNWDDDSSYENYVNKHYIPKTMKRYYRKQKPFQMNIERNVDISFEPFFKSINLTMSQFNTKSVGQFQLRLKFKRSGSYGNWIYIHIT